MKPIYLDHAATTPLHPAVLQAMIPYLTEHFGNPSSLHAFGRAARHAVTEARVTIAERLGCDSKQLFFTSGGTESDNLAIFGTCARFPGNKHIITSQIEHHAVLHACERLAEQGVSVTYVPVDRQGRVNPDDVARAVRPETVLISIMYANNEVGTLQPIEEIGRFAREKGICFHVDAVQALGSVELNLSELPVDLMSFSAHKIQGPKGTGALYCASGVYLPAPLLYGGAQERKRRPGTEHVAGIVGFAEAVRLVCEHFVNRKRKMELLRQIMIEEFNQLLPAGFTVNGSDEFGLPHILNVSFPGVSSETMLMNLDLEGVMASSGSACSAGSLEPSHVLQAMGLPEEVVRSAVRFSFGADTEAEDVRTAAKKIATIVRRIRNK